jgi:hypothetical protein
MRRATIAIVLCTAAAGGCSKKNAEAEGASAAALPALTADPEPAPIVASEKAPLESVTFRMTAKRNGKGWPKYTAYNLGTKLVTAIAIYAYAYDASGKQIARTQTPMSWNGKLAAAGKSDWDIEVGMSGPDVPTSAVAYDVCYDAIKFDGETKWNEDTSHCPAEKPRGK